MNTTSTTNTVVTALALTDELARVRLELELAQWDLAMEQLRAEMTSEEEIQRAIKAEIDRRIGSLQRDVESLSSIVSRLEFRLRRLNVAHRPLSDTELDDEEQNERAESAAYWAEWRQQRDERAPAPRRDGRRPSGKKLLAVYRQLARLIHPDLARDETDRAKREVVMRIANVARDAGDTEQLQRLILLWSQPEPSGSDYELAAVAKRIEQREREHKDLQNELKSLRDSIEGRLARRSAPERERYFKREGENLRRELANLRLRRRRLLRTVDDRRRELSQVSD